jgi:hypothetical protein
MHREDRVLTARDVAASEGAVGPQLDVHDRTLGGHGEDHEKQTTRVSSTEARGSAHEPDRSNV